MSMSFITCIFCHFQELRSQFDNCLADGQPLLVTDIDVNVFKNDPRFGKIILSRTQFTVGKNPFKIPVCLFGWLCFKILCVIVICFNKCT